MKKVKGTKKVYNTSVLIDDQGEIQAVYRKMHLFDAIVDGKILKESRFFIAGKTPTLTRIDGFKVGLSVCYDLRFPELYRRYAQKKAIFLCVPASFTKNNR